MSLHGRVQVVVGIPTAACCLVGMFSGQTGSICERTHSTSLACSGGQTCGLCSIWAKSRGLGGECLHYLDLEVGVEVGLEMGLEVGLTAQRRQRTAPKGV